MRNLNVSMRSALESSYWPHEDMVFMVEAYDNVAYVNFGYNGDNGVTFNSSLQVDFLLPTT